MTTKSNQAVASNDDGSNENRASKASSDYINHYLAGSPIIYIYRVTEYIDPESGSETWFYKGNMKTGAKSGNNFIPIEGSLSKNAIDVLEPVIDLMDCDDIDMKRSVGVTVKTPRFEGVNAFQPEGADKPVGVARFRINTILNTRLFKKKGELSVADDAGKKGKSGKATQVVGSDDMDDDIPF